MEWQDYIADLLAQKCSFDGISLSFNEGASLTGVPPIIKSSILLLDQMLAQELDRNFFVFPEKTQSIFFFTLIKLLHNITEGKIERAYDPGTFHPGEKLKLGNAIVEFVGIEGSGADRKMRIRLAEDLTITAPVEFFPLFQLTNTRRRLSNNALYSAEKKKLESFAENSAVEGQVINLLANYRTHMDSSIVFVSSVRNAKELVYSCNLCGHPLKNLILVGQADFEGHVYNIGSGQLGGTPAIVLASDLYAVSSIADQGHPIQSIIIDGSNANALANQMDALDEILRLGKPITCVTDIVNSFDLQPFRDRTFNVWRWDDTSITHQMYDISALGSDIKAKHCANWNVKYIVTQGNEISFCIRTLYALRNEVQTLSAQMLKLFDKFFALAFTALRETVPVDDSQLSQINMILAECETILHSEKKYLAQKTFDDYSSVLDHFKRIFSKTFFWPKRDALANCLCDGKYKSVCIIVSDRTDKKFVKDYWQSWCYRQRNFTTQIYVLHPVEYYSAQPAQFDVTIVVSWLKRAIMRKILYSFNTQDYIVLLYDYENRWKNFDTAKWASALNSSQTQQVIAKTFPSRHIHMSASRFTLSSHAGSTEAPKTDEVSEIEVVLRENKYRQYIASGGQKSADETAEAIPVNYIGGYLSFFRTGHKIISATDIIMNDSENIVILCPDQLKIGDFVVVREADHDLIREIADAILSRSGYPGARKMAGKWREVLQIETLFYSDEEIYQHLQAAGCTKGYQAVKRWIHEDVIAPDSKQDLAQIAKATQSDVLAELLDQVYDSAQTVRSAHIQAGRVLTNLLRQEIVSALHERGEIDPFNIWEPIEMQVDGVGLVRILKIIDIGDPVTVDIADTNRLIDNDF